MLVLIKRNECKQGLSFNLYFLIFFTYLHTNRNHPHQPQLYLYCLSCVTFWQWVLFIWELNVFSLDLRGIPRGISQHPEICHLTVYNNWAHCNLRKKISFFDNVDVLNTGRAMITRVNDECSLAITTRAENVPTRFGESHPMVLMRDHTKRGSIIFISNVSWWIRMELV